MRYIDPNLVATSIEECQANWLDEANRALEEVKALIEGGAENVDVSKAINDRSHIWRDLKDVLRHVSEEKCWYCESRNVRSDNAVDHYRPKNRVAECDTHPGYWWLAFDWKNYRYSCTFCNSRRKNKERGTTGGKHDAFPLFDEGRRVYGEQGDLTDEQPLLLDPMRLSDPDLLWFDQDGLPVPHPRIGHDENSYLCQRVEESINLYHLNHPGIVEERIALFGEIQNLLKAADNYFMKYDYGDTTAQSAFEDNVARLRQLLQPKAVHSSAARAMMAGLRTTYGVADVILKAA